MYNHQRLATKLISKRISAVHEASVEINSEIVGPNKLIPVVLEPDRDACSLSITIPTGFKALVTSNQRYVGIWSAGFHFAKPWEKVSHLVTNQYIVYDAPVRECPTSDNVMVEIDVAVVFHIKDEEEDVKNFVYKLGPNELENMLHAYQEEAVRAMARQKKYTQIYDLMDMEQLDLPQKVAAANDAAGIEATVGALEAEPVMGMPGMVMPGSAIEMKGLKQTAQYQEMGGASEDDDDVGVMDQLDNTKRSMNAKLNEFGVNIYSITITNVVLPHNFKIQMEDATTFDSKNKKAHAEQQFLILVQNDNEAQEKAKQMLREELAEAQAKNEQRVANEMKITHKFEAETNKLIADITESTNANVRDLNTSSSLEVTRLEKAKELAISTLEAEAMADVSKIRSEMEAFVVSGKAEADMEVQKLKAQELQIIAEAEGIASTKMRSRREFDAKMAQLRVLQNLGSNDQVVISGTNKDSVMAQLVGAKNSALAISLNE